ncbi:MAG: transketolase-like TK C-terminal-containing protein, partial [Ornithinimicrobium sp.]|uniref:transketolase-like TK C-terminal-containing protein n=1 Tax=Ornithinimicrobium sp. TaxID=1977084 RepID=UPI003D9B591C
PAVRARVSVEAGVAQGWREIVGDAGRMVSLEHFGASADYETLYQEFGITAKAVAQAARDSIQAAQADEAPAHNSPTQPGDEADAVGDADAGGHRSSDATEK